MKLSNINRRSAFTLLELLVVIAIIGILAALTAGGIMRLKQSQTDARTSETLQKLQSAYEQQYKSAVDTIRKEQVSPGLIALANNDVDLAKAIHLKLRLRREFPQNLSDVDDTGVTGDATLNAQLKGMYPPKAVYTSLLATITPLPRDQQNAILFMTVMSQGRGGSSFNPEQIGAGAIGTIPNVNGKVFVDGGGNPIYFVRALSTPQSGDTYTPILLTELNGPPYVTAAAVTAKKADPLDPTGRLSRTWTAPMSTFIQNLRLYMNEPLDGTFRGPFVFSAGTDKTPFSNDDMYGFRLTGTGKAN